MLIPQGNTILGKEERNVPQYYEYIDEQSVKKNIFTGFKAG